MLFGLSSNRKIPIDLGTAYGSIPTCITQDKSASIMNLMHRLETERGHKNLQETKDWTQQLCHAQPRIYWMLLSDQVKILGGTWNKGNMNPTVSWINSSQLSCVIMEDCIFHYHKKKLCNYNYKCIMWNPESFAFGSDSHFGLDKTHVPTQCRTNFLAHNSNEELLLWENISWVDLYIKRF